MKKGNGFIWISSILLIVPAFLLFIAGIGTYLNIHFSSSIVNSISAWPAYIKVIFFNTVFFLLPLLSLILNATYYKKIRIVNILVGFVALLVLLWYAVHLALD